MWYVFFILYFVFVACFAIILMRKGALGDLLCVDDILWLLMFCGSSSRYHGLV